MAAVSLIYFLILHFLAHELAHSLDFAYTGFNQTNLTLDGATIMKPTGALKLTNNSKQVVGHAFYPDPIQFFTRNSSNSAPTNVSSFSTHFVFAIVSPVANRGGHGLAFTLSPSKHFPGAEAGHYLGIFNPANDGSDSNHIFAVEFDTVDGHNENLDTDGNHVGININNMDSIASEPASYYIDGTDKKEEVNLQTGDPIQAWIDYDGESQLLNITICPLDVSRPIRPLKSRVVNLTANLLEKMYVGFSAATGEQTSFHYILGWSFSTNGIAGPIDLTQLPLPANVKRSGSSFRPLIKALLGVLTALVILLFVALIYLVVYRKKMKSEILEDWELDCPHRFRYKDLHLATKGFKESELLGTGGFGAVYKGVLPSTGSEIAVKKISSNSIQGVREFAAEIESLGRLRHKNLVNLQGWCKRKNELLLVYDYIPNGSLNSVLFRPRTNFILSWDQRFSIIKDIVAGLLYLHEEWEQVVIHRDVKSSNVLIDAEMGARLGDFGLARLYDRGQNSHTTNVVGTIGYIAPELAKTGKSSTSSDVFAFGVLLLELLCGRGPIVSDPDRDQIMLVDWVVEHLQTGKNEVLDIVDPKFGGEYVVEEVELVLRLGLVCCHPRAQARPTMRQVTRYLDGDDSIPWIEENLHSAVSRHVGEYMWRRSGRVSSDGITSSNKSSSVGAMSSSSFEMGR